MHLSRFEAIIFDCDGVLINSELIVQAIEREYLGRLGLHYEHEDFVTRFTGTADDEFFAALNEDALERTGRPLPVSLPDEMNAAAWEAFEASLAASPGVREFARAWRGLRAVASSSSVGGLQRKLALVSLDELFAPHVYSAELAGRGKPAPDIFLYTARQLRVDPARCLVIEDSVNGILAARAADMPVIGYLGGGHSPPGYREKLESAGASLVVDHFDTLHNLLD